MDIAMNLSTCATATAAMILSLQLKNHFDSLALLHPVGNGQFRSTQVHGSKETNLQRYCRSNVDSRINLQLVEPISPYSTTPCKSLQTTTKAAAAIQFFQPASTATSRSTHAAATGK
jgi:hypothetical protein